MDADDQAVNHLLHIIILLAAKSVKEVSNYR